MEIVEIIVEIFGASPALGVFVGSLVMVGVLVSMFYFL
jgi:hypothetical protein